MSEFTYELGLTPTLNGVPQDTIQVQAGESHTQSALGVGAFHLEAGEAMVFEPPADGRGIGVFGTGPFTFFLDEVAIPLNSYGGSSAYKVGVFLPGIVTPFGVFAEFAPVNILALGFETATPFVPPSGAGTWLLGATPFEGGGWFSGGFPYPDPWLLDWAAPLGAGAAFVADEAGSITAGKMFIPLGESTFDQPAFFTIFKNGADSGSHFAVPAGVDGNFSLSGPTPVVTYVPGDLLELRLVTPVVPTAGSILEPSFTFAMEDA